MGGSCPPYSQALMTACGKNHKISGKNMFCYHNVLKKKEVNLAITISVHCRSSRRVIAP